MKSIRSIVGSLASLLLVCLWSLPLSAQPRYWQDQTGQLSEAQAWQQAARWPLQLRQPWRSAVADWAWRPVLAAEAGPQRVLVLGVPDVRFLQLWHRSIDGSVRQLIRLDEGAAYTARPLPARLLALPLPDSLQAGDSLLLRYRTHGNTPLQLDIAPRWQWQAGLADSNMANGLQLGVLLALMVFALLQYLLAGERTLALYAALAAAMMAMLLQLEGYTFAWLWPQGGGWNQLAPPLLMGMVLLLQSLFALSLFGVARSHRRLYLAYLAQLGSLPLAGFAYFYAGWLWPSLLSALAYLGLILYTGAYYGRRGSPLAVPFLAGALLNVLLSNVLFGLVLSGLALPVSPFALPKLGYAAEALCFAVALARKVQLLQRRVADSRRRHEQEALQLAQAEAATAAARQLARASQLQLAATSHDLSQPLASLRLAVGALAPLPQAAPVLAHVNRTLDYSEALLGGLIAEARGQLQAVPASLPLGPLLADACQRHAAVAAAKGLRLVCHDSVWHYPAAPLLLGRILDNLLVNAIRYTASGSVLLGVRYRPDARVIEVRDSGPGLAAGQLQRLLQPFQRGEGQGGDGHGLGLHITRSLCEAAGYMLEVRSTLGKGAVFAVVLPWPAAGMATG
jgi:signal transduction histidine kinase